MQVGKHTIPSADPSKSSPGFLLARMPVMARVPDIPTAESVGKWVDEIVTKELLHSVMERYVTGSAVEFCVRCELWINQALQKHHRVGETELSTRHATFEGEPAFIFYRKF